MSVWSNGMILALGVKVMSVWSNGVILASGAKDREFNSRA